MESRRPRLLRPIAAALACTAAAGAFLVLQRPPAAQAPPFERAASRADRLATAAPEPPTHVLVRYEKGAAGDERASARRGADVALERSLPLPRLDLVRPRAGVPVDEAVARLERSRHVAYAEPDFERRISAMPSDELFRHQWGLHNVGQTVGGQAGTVDADIDAAEAWDRTTGAAGVIVAVVDSGLERRHRDIAPNVWRNPGESGGGREANGKDDDRNGYVDDVHGWDFVGADADPEDPNGHGTHVAGIVGASGNDGVGVAGVAWRVGLMPLRVLGADGSGRVSDVIAAYTLAGRMGVRILNASLGGDQFSRSERDAIAAAPSTLFVTAGGNDAADTDTTGSYPCNYDLDNIVCVAAVDSDGALASFSNRGARTVDLAAPGVAIASTYPPDEWRLMDGTSMATPHVAGAAALVWSLRPDATVAQVRAALLGSVQPHSSLVGVTVTGGTLNARGALAAIAPAPTPTPTPSPTPTPTPTKAPAKTPTPTPTPASTPTPTPTPRPAAPITNGSSPAPAIAPGAAPDGDPPSVAVDARRRSRARALVRRGLRVRVGCSESCTVRARLVVPRRTARRSGLRSGRRPVPVGRARGGTTTDAPAALRVRVRKAAGRRLRRAAPLRLRLVVRATDVAGNARTVRRSVRVRR